MVTVICKASFAFVPGGEMTLIAPEPIQRTDSNTAGPFSSTCRANEIAPQLRAVDVMMTGHAYPADAHATQGTVRLTLQNETGALLDRGAFTLGKLDLATGLRGPVQRVPLGYERAYGGIGCAENPLGVGFGANANEAPNLVHPQQADQVTSFAAVPSLFPSRKRLLGELPRSVLSQRVVELPSDFNWGYFQAAPPSQQLAELRGGEWLSIEGVLLGQPLMQTRIPRLQGLARVHAAFEGQLDVAETLALRLDMLQIDADHAQCHIVWRGTFPLADEAAVGHMAVVTGLESDEDPIAWPEPEDLGLGQLLAARRTLASAQHVRPQAVPPAVPQAVPQAVRYIDDDADDKAFSTVALDSDFPMRFAAAITPFALAAPTGGAGAQVSDLPGAPWARSAPPAINFEAESSTVARDDGEAARLAALEQARRAENEQRRQEELARTLKAEETAKREAEELTARELAAESNRIEAEARRLQDAEKFKAEQLEAKRSAERRATAKVADKREQTDQVKRNLYGAFKRKH